MPAHPQRHWLNAACSAAFIFLFLLLLPTPLGGNKSYIILAGNSMEPQFSSGDLVIVRQQLTYAVGDAVQYEHPYIQAVFHRIVGVDGEQFVMQGDNNGWVDSARPGSEQIVGKLWLHIPRVGQWIGALRTPRLMALTSTLLSAAVVLSLVDLSSLIGPAGGLPGKKKDAMISDTPAMLHSTDQTTHDNARLGWLSNRQISVLSYLGMLAAIALYLLVMGFSNPVRYDEMRSVSYRHQGRYAYTAQADEDVYDADSIQTGEPIFLRLNNSFDVLYAYELVADEINAVSGSYRMLATVTADNGWNRSFELVPETPLASNSVVIVGTVNLADIQHQVSIMREETGVQTSRFSLWVMPVIKVAGEVEGVAIADQFAEPLEFRFDDLQVMLRPDAELEPHSEMTQLLPITQRGSVTLPLVKVAMDVWWMRALGMTLMALTLGAAATLVLVWRARHEAAAEPQSVTAAPDAPRAMPARRAARVMPIDEAALATTQPSAMNAPAGDARMVDAETVDLAGRQLVQVTSMNELAALAQQQGRTIHKLQADDRVRYYVLSRVTANTYVFEERRAG